jgi:hypothetical protein
MTQRIKGEAPDLTKDGIDGDGEIITASGKWFNVLDPYPGDVDILDIAASLSKQCRFTGHVKSFYSTAQHSVLVANLLEEMGYSPMVIKQGLLHDASEAYLSDIARPVKRHPEFGPFYTKAEDNLSKAIFEHFELNWPMNEAVNLADSVLLRTEARDLMPPSFPKYDGATMPGRIIPWTPEQSEFRFLRRYSAYFGV